MKVQNMRSAKGNKVLNQFVIEDGPNSIFQSYASTIARIDRDGQSCNIKSCMTVIQVTVDSTYWDYSRTTSKYLGQFLGEPMKDVRAKVKSGEYKLANLN